MGTHGLRFLRNFFASLRFLTSLISLMMTLPVEYFCRFQLVMATCGFVAVTLTYSCQIAVKCGQMPKLRNYRYFL